MLRKLSDVDSQQRVRQWGVLQDRDDFPLIFPTLGLGDFKAFKRCLDPYLWRLSNFYLTDSAQ